MLKTVFLDLDDTILDFTRAEAAALRRALTEADVPADDGVLARYHAINAAQWELLEEGVLTREQVLLGRFDILFGELGLVRSAGEICERYEEYLGEGHWFIPGAEALLETGLRRVFISMGGDGVLAADHSGQIHVPCIPGKMVNTTGCGDAFMAAIAWAYLEGTDLEGTARAGLAASSIAMESGETINPSMSVEGIRSRI